MKRSTMLLVGAAGITLAAWGTERAINRPRMPVPLPSECVLGPDGKMPALPQCQTAAAQRSASSSSTTSRSSSGWTRSYSGSNSSASSSSGSHGPAVSRGGFGSSSRSFSSGS